MEFIEFKTYKLLPEEAKTPLKIQDLDEINKSSNSDE